MASDSFTDADGTGLEVHDANWGNCSGRLVSRLEINSNMCEAEAAWGGDAGARYTASSVDTSQVVLKGGPITRKRLACVRAGAANLGYAMNYNVYSAPNFDGIDIIQNGTWIATRGAGTTWAAANDHTFKITVSGSGATVTIQVFVDDVQIGADYGDSSAGRITAAGNPGFYTTDAATVAENRVDDWTDGAAAGGSVIPLDDRGILRGMGRGINRGMSRIN